MDQHDRGHRRTKSVDTFEALERAETFVCARDLHRALTESGAGTGLATVYRHLHSFVAEGRAETVRTTQGELFRAVADASRAHLHLVCDSCGSADEVTDPLDDDASGAEWIAEVGERHGFRIGRHAVEVHGRCARCG